MTKATLYILQLFFLRKLTYCESEYVVPLEKGTSEHGKPPCCSINTSFLEACSCIMLIHINSLIYLPPQVYVTSNLRKQESICSLNWSTPFPEICHLSESSRCHTNVLKWLSLVDKRYRKWPLQWLAPMQVPGAKKLGFLLEILWEETILVLFLGWKVRVSGRVYC